MSASQSAPKRGRGRPRTIPAGGRNVRCVLTDAELGELREAVGYAGASQQRFARAAVVAAARATVARKKIPDFMAAAIDTD